MLTQWPWLYKCSVPDCHNHVHRCFKVDGWQMDHAWLFSNVCEVVVAALSHAQDACLLDVDGRLLWISQHSDWATAITPVISLFDILGNIGKAFWQTHAHDIIFSLQSQVSYHCPEHNGTSDIDYFLTLKLRRHADAPTRFPSFAPDNCKLRIGQNWYPFNSIIDN